MVGEQHGLRVLEVCAPGQDRAARLLGLSVDGIDEVDHEVTDHGGVVSAGVFLKEVKDFFGAYVKDATAEDLVQFCEGRLAGFKRPRAYRVVGEAQMPRTATGKIQHRVLRERMLGR